MVAVSRSPFLLIVRRNRVSAQCCCLGGDRETYLRVCLRQVLEDGAFVGS